MIERVEDIIPWAHHREILQALREMEDRIGTRLDAISNRLGDIMTSQDDINNMVTGVTALLTDMDGRTKDLGTDVTALQAEISKLSAQGVDTTALNTLAASIAGHQQALDGAVGQVTALVPAAPAA